MFRTLFCWTCEQVFEHRISKEKDEKHKVFKLWRGVMFRSESAKGGELDLGGFDDIPVKWGSVSDTGRRKSAVAKLDDRYTVAASDDEEDEEEESDETA